MRKSSDGHLKDPTCGLKGGFLVRSPLGELPPGESIGCLASNGGDQNLWVHKLVN